MNTILIMLSTYNGEKYIKEQLDSLYSQKNADIHILVRDDGSKDNTINILEEYKNEYGRMDILKENNVGASRSFYRLMQYAYYEMTPFDYYSFCDQDDVWFQYKLELSCNQLDASSEHPQLFYAPAVPVDAELNPIKYSHSKSAHCLGANIASSHSLGCTQVFNRALLQKSVLIYDYAAKHTEPNTYYPLHDAWNALVAYTFGMVEVGDAPLMFYRQHGNNVVGSGQRGIKKLISRIKRYSNGDRKKSGKCRILLELFGGEIPEKNRSLIELCANYGDSYFKRLKLAFTKELYHYGASDNFGIFLVILLNRF